MTIRLRLTLWYSGLLLVLIALLGMTVLVTLDRTLHRQVDSTLREVARDAQKQAAFVLVDPQGEPITFTPLYPQVDTFGSEVYIQFWRKGETDYPVSLSYNLGTHYAPLDKKGLAYDYETSNDVTIDNVKLRVITRPIFVHDRLVGHVQVAASLKPVETALDRLLTIMLSGGLIALGASFMLGNWLAGRVVKPISSIAGTAQQIVDADDLEKRIPHDGPKDEIGHLTTTINQMLERLEKLFNSQRRFVSDISHELRTPLTSIIGNVELARRYGLQPDMLGIIEAESHRINRLINDLLMLAQADIAQLPLSKNRIQLDRLLREVFANVQMLAKEGVALRLEKTSPLEIEGDGERLKQLLMQLINNALTYTNQGSITLSLHQNGEWAEIHVVDTGIGIPAEDLPHIFDRFYRVDKARSRQAGGTGLGLSIAKWIAEAHGGTLTAQSQPQHGSTFTLRLPLAK